MIAREKTYVVRISRFGKSLGETQSLIYFTHIFYYINLFKIKKFNNKPHFTSMPQNDFPGEKSTPTVIALLYVCAIIRYFSNLLNAHSFHD